jgi:2-polyprenyl-3-methyl-5-hydroxy-6-metoxy-1,4-benzoquinol methylase
VTISQRKVAANAPCELCSTEMVPRRVGHVDMVVCSSCGLGRMLEIQTSADYWVAGGEDQLAHVYWAARTTMFDKALAHLEKVSAPGRVVDIGGGVGRFSECALQRGWDAYSCDVSPAARKTAAERLGAERSLSPEDLSSFEGTADVATLWCVIAHVLDPSALISQAVDVLKPGGRLLLTTPNFLFQKALARLVARFGIDYDLASWDHILHFTPRAIDALLRRAGLSRRTFEYLGVTEYCILSPSHAGVLVPLKRLWNFLGVHSAKIGLPPLSAELQVVAVKPSLPPSG